MSQQTIKGAYQKALKEGVQPNCPYCQEPLRVYLPLLDTWTWDEKRKNYELEGMEVDDAAPYCANCETADWDFFSGEEAEKLGLGYC